MTRRVLITGATGYIGRELVTQLARRNWVIRAAIRTAPSPEKLLSSTEFVIIPTIDGATEWSAALEGVDAVVHLAAHVHVLRKADAKDVALFRTVNAAGTGRFAGAAVSARVKRFVFVSSIGVNGQSTAGRAFTESDLPHPDNAYAVSKWEGEQALWKETAGAEIQTVVVRPPMVYGPGAPGNFDRLLKLVTSGIPLPLASIRNQRSFIYVKNLCAALCECLESKAAAGQTFLVSDGEDVSTAELMKMLYESFGCSSRLVPFPPTLLKSAANVFGFRYEAARILDSLVIDSTKIRSTLGWKPPYSLREAIRETVEAFRSVHPRS